jgi:hypothetical protein
MKLGYSNRRNDAMTPTEVLVILVVLAVLIALIDFGPNAVARRKARQIQCVSNLREIEIAFKIWDGDAMDGYPTQYSVKFGGALELVATGNIAAVFQVMSNELKTAGPRILICPADTNHIAATNWTTDFGNNDVSYFVGLDATEANPSSVMMGDDNFEINGAPVKSGVIQLTTNTPIAWTGERHRYAGNIALTDGEVQMTTSSGLTNAIIRQGEVFIYKHIPDSNSNIYSTNRFRIAIP